MRALLLVILLALGEPCRPETVESVETSPQPPRAAKMGDSRADYYAKKYGSRPRPPPSAAGQQGAATASAPIPAYVPPPAASTSQPDPSLSPAASQVVQRADASYPAAHGNQTARFFGLSTTTQDLQVGLQFTVPFISLPVGRLLGQYTDWSGLLQVNWPSVLALGAAVLAMAVLVPWLAARLGGVNFPATLDLSALGLSGFGRSADDGDAGTPPLLERVQKSLAKYDIDAGACSQRAICTYVREAAVKVQQGRAESNDLLLDGLATNSYVDWWLDGSGAQEAVRAGRSGANCAQTFTKCPLTADAVYRSIAKYMANAI